MSEQTGNDELLREAGAWDDVERKRAEDVEQERREEQRTENAKPVDDGGGELDEP